MAIACRKSVHATSPGVDEMDGVMKTVRNNFRARASRAKVGCTSGCALAEGLGSGGDTFSLLGRPRVFGLG